MIHSFIANHFKFSVILLVLEDRHDIAEILLKVVLNTITLTHSDHYWVAEVLHWGPEINSFSILRLTILQKI
jgi:hypothetical protein